MNLKQLAESKRPKRGKAHPPCVKSAYFGADDLELYGALAELAPSRNGGGPNLTAYLKSHKEAILAEAEAKKSHR